MFGRHLFTHNKLYFTIFMTFSQTMQLEKGVALARRQQPGLIRQFDRCIRTARPSSVRCVGVRCFPGQASMADQCCAATEAAHLHPTPSRLMAMLLPERFLGLEMIQHPQLQACTSCPPVGMQNHLVAVSVCCEYPHSTHQLAPTIYDKRGAKQAFSTSLYSSHCPNEQEDTKGGPRPSSLPAARCGGTCTPPEPLVRQLLPL